MATSGGFIIGVKNVPPIPPRLVIVIEPPWNSFLSIFKFLHLSLTSFYFCDKSDILNLSASLILGTIRPCGVSTAIPIWKYFFNIIW